MATHMEKKQKNGSDDPVHGAICDKIAVYGRRFFTKTFLQRKITKG